MKTHITLIFLVLYTGILNSQVALEKVSNSYDFTNTLKISPIELGRAEFQVSYERFIKDRKQSIVLVPSIILGSGGDESRTGFQIMTQYRFYLSHLRKETHETLNMYNIGFYAAPYALGLGLNEVREIGVYDPITYEYEVDLMESNIMSFEGGAIMGIQLDITKRIVMDFYAGGGLRKSTVDHNLEDVDNSYGILDIAYTGVKPRIGFAMGITF